MCYRFCLQYRQLLTCVAYYVDGVDVSPPLLKARSVMKQNLKKRSISMLDRRKLAYFAAHILYDR